MKAINQYKFSSVMLFWNSVSIKIHPTTSYILYIYTEANNVCDIPATQKKKNEEVGEE
jgi:hypothetical protein